MDELKEYDIISILHTKGRVIQQQLEHTVLKCIGPLIENSNESNQLNILTSFDNNNIYLCKQKKNQMFLIIVQQN